MEKSSAKRLLQPFTGRHISYITYLFLLATVYVWHFAACGIEALFRSLAGMEDAGTQKKMVYAS
jgi:hypothetical protein